MHTTAMTLEEAFKNWQQKHVFRYPITKLWFKNHSKNVQVVSFSEWLDVPPEIANFTLSFTPQKNECYKNAFECAKQVPGVEYVEGLVKANILNGSHAQYTNHAWNAFQDLHFDLTPISATSEITNPYFQLLKIDHPNIEEVESFVANGYYSFCISYIRFKLGEQ